VRLTSNVKAFVKENVFWADNTQLEDIHFLAIVLNF